MRMNLRQIVRNQKLSSFNYKLSDFISEADDEEVKKKDAFAGKTKAGSSKYWYVNKQGQMKAVVNPPKEGGWELADKDQAKEAEEREKDVEVDIDDEARDFINQEMEAQNLKPSREDENVFVDKDGDEIFQIDADGEVIPGGDIDKFKSAEGEPYADYIQDINDRLYGDDEEEEGEEEGGEEGEEEGEEGYDWRAVTIKIPEDERPTPEQINDLRMQMFDGKTGRSSDWAGEANSTPDSDPPSDARARTTAIDAGYPPSKEKRKSNITGEMAAPAPGNPGSMMNEVFSVEGCNIAEAFYERFGTPPTVDEMEAILQEQFGDSQLSKDNDGPNGPKYKEKLRIAAEASITKFDRLQNGLSNTADSDPPFGVDENGNSTVIRPPSQFYGAAESIEAQINMVRGVEYPAKIYGPDGPIESISKTPQTEEELMTAIIQLAKYNDDPQWAELSSNPDAKKPRKVKAEAVKAYVDQLLSEPTSDEDNHQKIKKFAEILVHDSGGGANPGDTATFVRDEAGNLMMMFHSDKMDRADQQTNSTMAAESRRQRRYIDDFAKRNIIDAEQQAAAENIMNETAASIEEVKNRDETPTVIKRIQDLDGKKKKVALEAVKILAQNRKKNPMESEGAKEAGVKTTEDYLNWLLKKDSITQEEAKTINRVFNLINGKEKGLTLDHDLDPEEMLSIDATSINAEKTAAEIRILDERRRRLDEIETKIKGPNGEPRGLGQVTAAQLIIDQYHLYAINDPSSLAYQSGMCASVIGTDVVNAETLTDCLEVDNTDELLGRLITEAPRQSEDDFEDEGIGVPNSMLQRSTDSFERDENGAVYYFTVNDDGTPSGKTTDPEDPNIQRSGKEKKPVRVGVATGIKMSSTFMNKEGDRFMVAQKSGRTKGGVGSNLETAGVYGKQLQDCIGAKGKSSLHKESVEHKLANILFEEKQNTLAFHWKKAEDDYPLHYFLRELNEGSLN